ncbi:WXG100 family type VII secretion target [Streptomyces fildesensis]|uniref:WXG100 family type VII secretion target n=1 Tax=Streptomyces fildesensis TaxID=375757 RepID=A0ABW8C5S0_9ACTN
MSLTLQDFKVALQNLQDVTELVRRKGEDIRDDIAQINASLAKVDWTGPAGTSFVEVHRVYTGNMAELTSLLDEMVKRMRHSYRTYHDMELANFNNVNS